MANLRLARQDPSSKIRRAGDPPAPALDAAVVSRRRRGRRGGDRTRSVSYGAWGVVAAEKSERRRYTSTAGTADPL
jgi:hypothetical protein